MSIYTPKNLPNIIKLPWYLLDQPWVHSDQAGMTILAGNPDPHVGIAVAETQDTGDYYDDETAQIIARHIVDLHNAAINNGEENDARIEYQIWNGYAPNHFLMETHPNYEQAKARWDDLVNINPSWTIKLHKVVWQVTSVTPLAVSE